jgi:hypothetical protein
MLPAYFVQNGDNESKNKNKANNLLMRNYYKQDLKD